MNLYYGLAILFVLVGVWIIYRRSGSTKKEQKSDKHGVMIKIIRKLSLEKNSVWRDEWPSPEQLYVFISLKLSSKIRQSNADIRQHVAKKYEMSMRKTKYMLTVYRRDYWRRAKYIKDKQREKDEQ